MTQKILLTIDIDDSQLDAAQGKVKLIQRAQVLLDEWNFSKDITCRLCP